MTARLLQWIGVIAVLALVAGSLIALSVAGRSVQVTVQDASTAAARGPDPVALLHADVNQLATDLGALTDGLGPELQALHGALEDSGRARSDALAAEIAALAQRVRELETRVARGAAEDTAARARIDQALGSIGARLDALAGTATSAAPEAAIEPEPAVELPPEVVSAPEPRPVAPPAKDFLTFKLPSQAFAYDRLQRWVVLASLSRVGFDARSTLHDFSASSQEIEGELLANLARPADGCKGTITVAAASLDSGEAGRDADMRALLDVARHPVLGFEWTGFTTDSSDATAMKTSGTVHGKLTIHGTTRELAMPVRISVDASRRVEIAGEAGIKMSDFGVEPPRKLGVISVEDQVKIWIALRVRSLGDAGGTEGD